MSHDQSYQRECSLCQSVAALEARADPLDTFIRRVVPRSYSQSAFAGELSLGQLGAIDWSSAIRNCLRRAMAPHPRCHLCTVLMGPGHVEAGLDRFCGTHAVIVRAA
jgi:hypothetical protein